MEEITVEEAAAILGSGELEASEPKAMGALEAASILGDGTLREEGEYAD